LELEWEWEWEWEWEEEDNWYSLEQVPTTSHLVKTVKKIVASDWSMGKTVKICFIFFPVFPPTNQKPSCCTFIHCFLV
jgi:hypothetical protein